MNKTSHWYCGKLGFAQSHIVDSILAGQNWISFFYDIDGNKLGIIQ
ncbi:MAG: hypothetical protein ACXWRZ_18240 [Bdellovibrio sp.]